MGKPQRKNGLVQGGLLRFFLFFVAAYMGLLLLFSYTPVGKFYLKSITGISQTFFGKFAGTGGTEFKMVKTEGESHEKMQVTIYNAEQKASVERRVAQNPALASRLSYEGSVGSIHLWVFAVVPFLFLLCLIIASPVNLGRKIGSIVLGSLIMHGFIFSKIWLYLMKEFNTNDTIDVVYLTETSERIVKFLYNMFENIGIALVLAVVTWLLLTFRARDFQKFSERINTK